MVHSFPYQILSTITPQPSVVDALEMLEWQWTQTSVKKIIPTTSDGLANWNIETERYRLQTNSIWDKLQNVATIKTNILLDVIGFF